MEYASVEIVIAGAVAVGCVRCTGGKPSVLPVFYIVGFEGIGLVPVFDFGVYRCYVIPWIYGIRQSLEIVGIGTSEIERTVEVYNQHLFAG